MAAIALTAVRGELPPGFDARRQEAASEVLTCNALAQDARTFWEHLGFMSNQRSLGFSHARREANKVLLSLVACIAIFALR